MDLTGIIDVATRTVTAAVLRPATKPVDASVLLARTVTPEPMRPGWPEAMRMAASALPFRRMLSIDERLEHAAARPVIIPQVIVVDHGKVFVSESFKASCAFLGISFQPARKATGTDKPHIERMLGSVATMFAQYVSGYTGRSPEYRGRGAEKNAVWSLPELQDLLDQWLIAEWQNRPHDGLRDPLHPGRAFSPNEKYAALIETAGYVPLALSPDDYIELLPATWRAVNAYGIKISRRVYDGKELNPLRMQHSGVTARKGLHEVHYDPYDISRVWVRDHWNGGWITVFWTQLHRVAAPFGELAWDHARKLMPAATEAELADAVEDLLTRAGQGPGGRNEPAPSGKRDRQVAGRTRAVRPAMPGRPGARAGRRTGSRRARQPGCHRPDADLRPVPRGGEMAVTAGSADPATQLTTLPGWRQFIAAVPSIPHLLPEQDWLSLEDGKRAAHDEERLEHHSRLVVVQTPVIGRIVRQGGNLIRMNRLARYGRSGLMVSGPARTGKTTAVTQLGKTAELMHRQRNPGSRDDIPVIYITVPPAATGKMIATEIARFLGLPVPRRANITDVIESVCGICLDTRVTMIIVELHNLDMTTRADAEASDTLKYFSERLPATFVYSGIGLDRGAMLAGPRGDQVAGRFTLIPASAFTPGQEWSALIAAIEGSLRLYHHKDGSLVTLADYLHRRTRGMIGSLHAASAQQPAASGSRSRCTFPPATRSASGTASGCPAREHRSSASAAAPTSWMPNAGHAGSSAAAPPSSSFTPGSRHPQIRPGMRGNAGRQPSSSRTPGRLPRPARRRCSRPPLTRMPSPPHAPVAKACREQSSLAQAAPASRRKRANQAFSRLRADNIDSSLQVSDPCRGIFVVTGQSGVLSYPI